MATRQELMAAVEAKRAGQAQQSMTRGQLMEQVELKRQQEQQPPNKGGAELAQRVVNQPLSASPQLTEIDRPAPRPLAQEAEKKEQDFRFPGLKMIDASVAGVAKLYSGEVPDLISGADRQTEQTQSLPEIGGLKVPSATQALKISAGLLATANEEDQIDILRKNVPGSKFFKDEKGNIIVKIPFDKDGKASENGQELVLNKPGLSEQDAVNAAANILFYMPSTAIASIGKSLGAKFGLGAVGAVATQEGLQKGAQALGAEREVSTGERVLAAGLGGAAEVAAPVVSMVKKAAQNKAVTRAIIKSSPDISVLKEKAKEGWKALDNLGVKVKPRAFRDFVGPLEARLKKEGLDKTLHPQSTAALKRLTEDMGSAKTFSELDTLRRIASDAAGAIDKPADARLGSIMVRSMDDAIDELSKSVGGTAKEARALSQRTFKSRTITDMIENAGHTASGLENGLRIEARKILKSAKKRRGFTPVELKALSTIEKGTSMANTAKFLGKFGVSEGQATSMLGASVGVGGGAGLGSLFGPGGAAVGAITVPALGQIAKKTAQRLTLKNTRYADALARAGKDARSITTAYLKNTPKTSRSVADLTEILLDSNLKPADLIRYKDAITPAKKLIGNSYYLSNSLKQAAKASAQLLNPEQESTK